MEGGGCKLSTYTLTYSDNQKKLTEEDNFGKSMELDKWELCSANKSFSLNY